MIKRTCRIVCQLCQSVCFSPTEIMEMGTFHFWTPMVPVGHFSKLSVIFYGTLAECLFQEQEFKMWYIGYAEMCLSICVCAFWELWIYNILPEGLFQEQEFKMWSIGYAKMCLSICVCAFCELWFYNIRENNRMICTARIQTYMS